MVESCWKSLAEELKTGSAETVICLYAYRRTASRSFSFSSKIFCPNRESRMSLNWSKEQIGLSLASLSVYCSTTLPEFASPLVRILSRKILSCISKTSLRTRRMPSEMEASRWCNVRMESTLTV